MKGIFSKFKLKKTFFALITIMYGPIYLRCLFEMHSRFNGKY